jgi:hypothetical protein
LDNITAGVREREDANRNREAEHVDEIQGVVANTRAIIASGAVGFIDWLDVAVLTKERLGIIWQSIAKKIAVNLSDFASSR